MRKKYLNALLFGALVVASTGTFTSCKDYDDDIDKVQANLDTKAGDLSKQLQELKAELTKASNAADANLAKAKEELNNALKGKADQATVDALNKSLEAYKAEAEKLGKTLGNLQALVETNKALAEKANANLKSELQKEIDGIKTSLSDYLKTADAEKAHKELADKIAALEKTVKANGETLGSLAGKFKEFKETVEKTYATKDELNKQIKTVADKVNGLEKTVGDLNTALSTTVSLKTYNEKVADIEKRITTLEDNSATKTALDTAIASLKAELSKLIGGRLTSLNFFPETWINGIEAMNFPVLNYNPWDEKKLLADAPTLKEFVTLENGTIKAVYVVSPSMVNPESIAKWDFIAGEGTNVVTRAIVDSPLEVVGKPEFSVDKEGKGIVTLTIAKTGSAPLLDEQANATNKIEKFITVALRAHIAEAYKSANEAAAPVVYSDFVRLTETKQTPYIHYTGDKEELYKNFKLSTKNDSQNDWFYEYTYFVPNENNNQENGAGCGTEAKLKANFDAHKYQPLVEIPYNTDGFDLNKLVDIFATNDRASGNATKVDQKNFKFEFNVVPYFLRQGDAQATNQAQFVQTVKGNIVNGILKSQAHGAVATNNRDAIGREPLIQIVLRDTKNNKVVDVRYFKIRWIDEKIEVKSYVVPDFLKVSKDQTYDKQDCDKTYELKVLTAEMNQEVYAKASDKGYSSEEFHKLFELDPKSYKDVECATEASLGTVKEIPGEDIEHTYNVLWTLSTNDHFFTSAEYKAGEAVRTAYFKYDGKQGTVAENSKVVFQLKMNFKIAKMAINDHFGMIEANWSSMNRENKNRFVRVNSIIETDKLYGKDATPTTVKHAAQSEILVDLLSEYTNIPKKVLDLVNNATDAHIVFDKDRLVEQLGKGWTVSEDGMTLMKGTEKAAVIEENSVDEKVLIRVWDGEWASEAGLVGSDKKVTSAARELIGKKLPVKLTGTYCKFTDDVDHYLVSILPVLKMTVQQPKGQFYDKIAEGSKVLVKGLVTVTEVQKYGVDEKTGKPVQRVVIGEGGSEVLKNWYAVSDEKWDIEKATVNVKYNEKTNNLDILPEGSNEKWMTFEQVQKRGLNLYLKKDGDNLVFYNRSGSAVSNGFKIKVPVYVTAKWYKSLQDQEKMEVVIPVAPNNVEGSNK